MNREYIIIAIDTFEPSWSTCVVNKDNELKMAFAPNPATVFKNYNTAYNKMKKFERQLRKIKNNQDRLIIVPISKLNKGK